MSDLYLLIGGNQGDRLQLIHQATDLIQQRIGSVVALSQFYETAPWGTFAPGETPQNFLNLALLIRTSLSPHQALTEALDIEKTLGRRRPVTNLTENTLPTKTAQPHLYANRPIDIDLIFYDNLVLDTPTLTLPHPRMHLRRFVLQPLCDIAPRYTHPVFNKTLLELLTECPDTSFCYCCY